MVYLRKFTLLNDEEEFLIGDGRRIYNSSYPIGFFSSKEFHDITFDNITIFAGSNGCGKTTLLNIISDKIKASRKAKNDKGTNFEIYVNRCKCEMSLDKPMEIKCITSDDVFDYLLDIRAINTGVNRRKEELAHEFLENKYGAHDTNFDSYEELKNDYDSKHQTMSKYIRSRLSNKNLVEQSNGESSLMFWEREIRENAIYLLDEPENSLSAENQLKLKLFIEESVRFYNCQFIISTHSPFLLSLIDAKIYNLDEVPVKESKWYELPNVRIYYDFFQNNKDSFEK